MDTYLCGKCGGPISRFEYGCPHCGVALQGVQRLDKNSYALKQRAWEEREVRRRAERAAKEWRDRWRHFGEWMREIRRRIYQLPKPIRELFGRIGQTRRELRTLLHSLDTGGHVWYSGLDAVQRTIKSNPSLARAKDKDGRTALHAATGYASPEILPLSTSESLTDIPKLLLSLKADVNAKTKHGITPLHCAAMSGNWAMVKLLLDHGADVKARSDEGKDARDYASQRKHENVKNWLSNYRSDTTEKEK